MAASRKSQLNLYCQGHHLQLPEYSTEANGYGFSSHVVVFNQTFSSEATHSSKKLAEEDAANVALSSVQNSSKKQAEEDATNATLSSIGLRKTFGGNSFSRLLPKRSSSPEHTLPLKKESDYTFGSSPPGLASRSINSDAKENCLISSGADDYYGQKLQWLCKTRGLSSPESAVKTFKGKYVATISIEGHGDFSSRESETRSEANEYASLIALAEVALKLLNINDIKTGIMNIIVTFNDIFSYNYNYHHPVACFTVDFQLLFSSRTRGRSGSAK